MLLQCRLFSTAKLRWRNLKVWYCKLRCRNLDFSTVNEYFFFLQFLMFCLNAIIWKYQFRNLHFSATNFDAALPTSAFQILILQSRFAVLMQLSRLGLRYFWYRVLEFGGLNIFGSAILISGLRISMSHLGLLHFKFSCRILDSLPQLSMPQARV